MDTLKPSSDSESHPGTVSDGTHTSTPETEQARFITEHSTCAMCDSVLDVRHESDHTQLKVKEEAHCPSCGIRVRSGHYLMH